MTSRTSLEPSASTVAVASVVPIDLDHVMHGCIVHVSDNPALVTRGAHVQRLEANNIANLVGKSVTVYLDGGSWIREVH